MKKLSKFNSLWAGTIALMLAAAPLAPAQEKSGMSAETKKEVIDSMNSLILNSAYVPGVDFKSWPKMLDEHKEQLDKADSEDEFTNVINSALAKFGFSHILLMKPEQVQARMNRSTVGLGVNIQPHEEGLLIIRVVPKSPAEEVGLKPGDILVEADGKKVTETTSLRGEEGTKVNVKVKREGQFKEFTVTRRKFSTVRPEELKWADKDTAVLNVYTFDLSYDRKNVDKLMKEASKAKNLILDLRNNGGGAVLNLQHLMGYFLPTETPIGTFVSRRMVQQYAEETGQPTDDVTKIAAWGRFKLRPAKPENERFTGKVVVLVNQFSGSASEIAAQALREHLGSPVIGTKSAGAVLVSVMMPIANGFQLQYPITDYVSHKGRRLEKNGVEVDVEATTAQEMFPGKADPAWAVALQSLTKTKN